MRMQVRGKTLSVEKQGNGDPVVLLHGLGSTANVWEPQVRALSDRFTLLRFDLEGRRPLGRDRCPLDRGWVDDLKALLDLEGIGKARLVGHSLGTLILQHFAAAHPQHVEKLVFIGVNRAPPEARRVAIRERVAKVRAEGIDAIVEAIVKGGLSPHTLSEKPEVVAFVRELLTRQSDEGYAKSCEAMAAAVAADAAAIKAPVLLVAGRDDAHQPARQQRGPRRRPRERPRAGARAVRPLASDRAARGPQRRPARVPLKPTSPRRAALATKIRHIALSVQDPEGTAKFYEEAFGLVRVGKTTSVLADGVYLSDGYLNIALLKYKSDEMAGMKGGAEFVGTHHFGFQVDDAEDSKKRIEECGGQFFMDLPALKDTLYYEEKFRDPEGVIFDISQHGWVTAGEVASTHPRSRARAAAAGGPTPGWRASTAIACSRGRRSRLAKTKSQVKGSGHCSRSCTPTVGACSHAGMQHRPRVLEGGHPLVEGRDHARVGRVGGAAVEVAGQHRRRRLRQAVERALGAIDLAGRGAHARSPRHAGRERPRPGPRAAARSSTRGGWSSPAAGRRAPAPPPRAASAACGPPRGRSGRAAAPA